MKKNRKSAMAYFSVKSGLTVKGEAVLTNPSVLDMFFQDKTGPWYTKLRRYQRDIGIAYYNLDAPSKSRMRKFLLKYVFDEFPDGSNPEGMADIEYITKALMEEQPRYRSILTSVVRNEPLSEDDISHMTFMLNDGMIPTRVTQRDRTLFLGSADITGSMCASGVLRAVYFFLLLPSTKRIELRKCAIEECRNFFAPHAGGHAQKFCSDACRVKAYTRRKKMPLSK